MNKDTDKLNILNKQGMLTDTDRKEKLIHDCNWVSFYTNLDFTEPIKVVPFGDTKELPVELYSQDLASFMVWWTHFIMKDLNGFSGFGNVKFELVGFKLV